MRSAKVIPILLGLSISGAAASGSARAQGEAPSFIEWTRTFGAPIDALRRTADGGYLIAGGEIAKLDAGGAVEWRNAEAGGNTIEPTADGGAIVGGHSVRENRNGDIYIDGVVTRFDAGGARLWSTTIQGDGDYDWSDNWLSIPAWVQELQETSPGGGFIAVFGSWWGIVELDAGGVPVCGEILTGPECFDFRICGVGSARRTADGGTIAALGSWSDHSGGKICLSRFDAGRQLLWRRTFVGRPYHDATVLPTPDGGYVLFTRGGGTIKTDAEGNRVWENPDADGSRGILTADGGYVVLVPGNRFTKSTLTRVDAEGRLIARREFPDWYLTDVQAAGDGGYIVSGNEPSGSGGVLVKLSASVFDAAIDLQPLFRRGDCNGDGAFDISDAVSILGSLFLGDGDPGCGDACDSNDDGAVDISDAVAALGVLFLGQGEIPLPGTKRCGADLTADPVDCERYEGCP